MQEYFKTGDRTILKLEDNNLEEYDDYYIEALIKIVKHYYKKKEKEQNTGNTARILKDDDDDNYMKYVFKYAYHILPLLIIFGIGFLSIFGWIICAVCACKKCSCCVCKVPKCKTPAAVLSLISYVVVALISFYALVEQNKIFSGLADIECAVLRFTDDFLEGETNKFPPYWAGIDKISTILTQFKTETENTITSQLKLILNTCNNTARFEIPPTDGTVNESAVRVDYLHTILATLSSDITNSAQAMEDLLNRLVALENVINPIKNYLRIGIISYPVDDSNALVTSNGIYDFVHDLLEQVPANTDTTYTFSFDPGTNKIVITPSSGTGTELDLSSLAGTAQVNKSIGTLVSCFIDSTHPTDANDVGQHITVPVGKILTGSDLIEFVETGTEFNTNTQSVDATDTVFAENDDGSINDTGWIPAWNDTWNVSNMSTETRYKCIVSPTFETSTVGDGDSTPTYKLTAGIFMRVL